MQQHAETLYREILRIGTRASALARTQTGHVAQALEEHGISTELHFVHTPGDASQASQIPVARIGVGVFTETLRQALHTQECDIAVHSMKDLPTAPDARFISVVPPRVDNREVLVSDGNLPLMSLREGAVVGTSAPRRIAQLRSVRPDLRIVPLRGNIDSRMARVTCDPSDERKLDAVILARAGLERVGLLGKAAETLDTTLVMPAPAQGALSVEVRADDTQAITAVQALDHHPSHLAALAERAMLATLEAGCSAPVAAHSTWDDNGVLHLEGGVFALDGSRRLVDSVSSTAWSIKDVGSANAMVDADSSTVEEQRQQARALGIQLGHSLLEAGAADIMATSNTREY